MQTEVLTVGRFNLLSTFTQQRSIIKLLPQWPYKFLPSSLSHSLEYPPPPENSLRHMDTSQLVAKLIKFAGKYEDSDHETAELSPELIARDTIYLKRLKQVVTKAVLRFKTSYTQLQMRKKKHV